MRSFKADVFVVDLQEQLSSRLIFDNCTSTSAQLELLYKIFHDDLEAHSSPCNASRKKAIAKKALVNMPNL